MTVKSIVLTSMFAAVSVVSCNHSGEADLGSAGQEPISIANAMEVKSYISMFEIPATDISRAIQFYEALLDIEIQRMDIEGMQMGILPYEGQAVHGVIIQAEGSNPSEEGVTLYLNVDEDLQDVLNRVGENAGQVIVPKTAHADDSGYFAVFLDSEGNRMALNGR